MFVEMLWPAERTDRLKQMHATREYSMGQIAEKLGVTRNAVIGKCKRLGLSVPRHRYKRWYDAGSIIKAAPKAKAPAVKKPKAKLAPKSGPPPDEPRAMVTFMQLRDDSCRFPIGDPRERNFRFCGRKKLETGSYCAACNRVVYLKGS